MNLTLRPWEISDVGSRSHFPLPQPWCIWVQWPWANLLRLTFLFTLWTGSISTIRARKKSFWSLLRLFNCVNTSQIFALADGCPILNFKIGWNEFKSWIASLESHIRSYLRDLCLAFCCCCWFHMSWLVFPRAQGVIRLGTESRSEHCRGRRRMGGGHTQWPWADLNMGNNEILRKTEVTCFPSYWKCCLLCGCITTFLLYLPEILMSPCLL